MGWWQYDAMKSEVSFWYLTAPLPQSIFNLDYASNGLGRNWFPAKWVACCAHQSLLFQHIHKSFLLYRRVRPRNRSLLPSVSVVRLSQCRGHTWLYFNKNSQPPYFSNISESENSGSRYFKPSRTARFHRRTSGYFTFSNVFVDNGLCDRKAGCLVFSENRDQEP
jgi:hypothetical protein